jgi:hypothetical protein
MESEQFTGGRLHLDVSIVVIGLNEVTARYLGAVGYVFRNAKLVLD